MKKGNRKRVVRHGEELRASNVHTFSLLFKIQSNLTAFLFKTIQFESFRTNNYILMYIYNKRISSCCRSYMFSVFTVSLF